MNSFQALVGGGGTGNGPISLSHGGGSSGLAQRTSLLQAFLNFLFFCCRSNGLLAKFPSRAKRIDVISRFIFPLIFAIFNLAYWMYYLLAKSKFPTMDG